MKSCLDCRKWKHANELLAIELNNERTRVRDAEEQSRVCQRALVSLTEALDIATTFFHEEVGRHRK